MKFVMKLRNSWPLERLIMAACMTAIACKLVGCTLLPAPVKTRANSFDGNDFNSGLVAFNADGSALITPHARERYQALVILYGRRFLPPLTDANAGIVIAGKNFSMDAQHLSYFATMNRWHKEGK